EFNSDTPSGLREAIAVEPWLHRRLGAGTRRLSARLAPLLCAAVDASLLAHRQRTGRPVRTLGLITQASYEEDLAQIAFLESLLQRHWRAVPGAPTVVLGDLNNLWEENGELLLLGRPLDALYRLYPYERLYGHPLFAPLFSAVTAGRLCLLNGLRGFLPQSKAVLAWLWEQRDSPRFTRRQRAALRDHLPPTYRLAETPPGAPRDRWVVKEFWGREGEEVYRGGAMSDDDWARCVGWGTFVAQEWVESVEVDGADRGPTGFVVRRERASVGSFVVANRFAGCYSRLGGPVINVGARYAATLAERRTR
ncbi:MAG: glutathionylspermidine synthase family protein, partial [Chloroflexi bacterium]|nr:glutathionylspermidine synthase family protein [Chloroflexota bacterium]